MFPNILTYLLLLILSSRLLCGSPVSVEQQSLRKISEEMLKFMNTSIDPCENFYEFTCGNYDQHYEDFTVKYGAWGSMYSHWDAQQNRKKKELGDTNENGTDADKKVKEFYKSCMAAPPLAPDAYSDKFKDLMGEFGKMPLLEGEQWQESKFDWVKTVAEINYKTDFGVIVDVNIVPDFADTTINRVSIIQPNFHFSKKIMYSDAEFKDTRFIFIQNIQYYLSELLGVEEELAVQAAEEIFEFEKALAQGMQDLDVTPPDELYDVIGIDELQEKYLPAWDSKKLLNTALDLYPERVMIQGDYLKVAFDVVQKTPKRIVANYILYTYLYEFIQSIPDPTTKMDDHCLVVVSGYFDEYLENLVYRKYYTEHDKAGINFLWQQLKPAFEEVLLSSRLNWIEHDTRQEAVEKLKAMRMKIGSYEDIDFVHRYAHLHMNSHDFLGNIYAILKLRGSEARARITKPPTFKVPPSQAPVFASDENLIYMPLADILPEILGPSSLHPYAQKFGGIGFLMGHEISHGFDDVNRIYDRNGNSRSWWDKQSLQEYDKRIECITSQYRNYTFRGVPLPEIERQVENIADNGGLRVAYNAYLKWYNSASRTTREREVLPGFNYNHKQLFFISFGQILCSAKSSTFVYDGDVHVPENLRIIGSLSNFGEFSKAFGCPKGSAMNPAKKCSIF